jgi:uncharacterized protein YndB with AHSA1/START domain
MSVAELQAHATIDIKASPERVFAALISSEVTKWWVRPGVFDTREWSGDARPGGTWRASGIGRGNPYALEGEFQVIDRPQRLVHTWHPAGVPQAVTTVTYDLERLSHGTRLTVTHEGFTSPEICEGTRIGWETSFARLAELLAAESLEL